MPTLSNNQVQEKLSKAIVKVENSSKTDMPLYQKSLALARLARAHIQCTRVGVYGIRATLAVGDKTLPDVATTLKMPVFKP